MGIQGRERKGGSDVSVVDGARAEMQGSGRRMFHISQTRGCRR